MDHSGFSSCHVAGRYRCSPVFLKRIDTARFKRYVLLRKPSPDGIVARETGLWSGLILSDFLLSGVPLSSSLFVTYDSRSLEIQCPVPLTPSPDGTSDALFS